MKKTVMIVDDSLFVAAEMKAMLEGSDFTVVSHARSGEDALTYMAETKADLVTMDIVLPGMDGLETTAQILQAWPDAKVLVISSLAYDDTVAGAQQAGAAGFLYKPFQKEQLLEALQNLSV